MDESLKNNKRQQEYDQFILGTSAAEMHFKPSKNKML